MSQGNCASEASTTTAASVAPARSSTALKPLARIYIREGADAGCKRFLFYAGVRFVVRPGV